MSYPLHLGIHLEQPHVRSLHVQSGLVSLCTRHQLAGSDSSAGTSAGTGMIESAETSETASAAGMIGSAETSETDVSTGGYTHEAPGARLS